MGPKQPKAERMDVDFAYLIHRSRRWFGKRGVVYDEEAFSPGEEGWR